ncbi:MAG TPA: cytochrome d ubiquinol oxidase subunit II [Xanthobacteraceae bacterium]|nr:cytochrome d ubiquinol oxidase subunit II [Xanthobacteraceae bacterium]
MEFLPLIWAVIIGTAVMLYVILDGFDLGVALLFPFVDDESQRDQMMRSVAPFWDGNETWLVMGGVGLLVAFPLAYAVIMPALYLPVIFMLLGLIFRGVAFEFRTLARDKRWWNLAFAAGSLVATLSQGAILGGLIQGIRVENNAYAGGPFDWASPLSLLCGVGLTAGYALLGATWLIWRTEGPIVGHARRAALVALAAVLASMGGVSLYTPLAFDEIAARWFAVPNIFWLWPVPVVTLLTAFAAWRWIETAQDGRPFFATIVLFLLGYLGLIISRFPYLVPPSLTIWDTAAVPSSQAFMLAGTVVLLPLILGYTAWSYWVFRGRVREGESYH